MAAMGFVGTGSRGVGCDCTVRFRELREMLPSLCSSARYRNFVVSVIISHSMPAPNHCLAGRAATQILFPSRTVQCEPRNVVCPEADRMCAADTTIFASGFISILIFPVTRSCVRCSIPFQKLCGPPSIPVCQAGLRAGVLPQACRPGILGQ
jgi:hypothetical protein